MKRQGLILLLLVCFSLIPFTQAQACADFESRLQPGMIARVTPGEPNNVRAEPSTSAELVGQLEGGMTFVVLDEAVCADDLTWWQVRNSLTGVEGYTVEGTRGEYWTEPASIDILAENMAVDFTAIADDISIDLIPAMEDNMDFRGASPDFVKATFESTIISEGIDSEIIILPIDGFERINSFMDENITYWQDRFLNPDPDSIPLAFIYPFGAVQLHVSHAEWLETDVMIGTRYLTMFAQYPAPIHGSSMFYTYQGVTRDGRYWVSAILPVDAPALNSYYDSIADGIWDDNGVTSEGHDLLSDFAHNMMESEFFPALNVLDDVVLSLNFDGAEGIPEPVTSRFPESYSIDISELDHTLEVNDTIYGDNDIFSVSIQPIDNSEVIIGWMDVYSHTQAIYVGFYPRLMDLQIILANQPSDLDRMYSINSGMDTYIYGEPIYIDTDTFYGIAYLGASLGRPVISPVSYRFQGFTKEDKFFVNGGYVIEVEGLPTSRDAMSEDELARATSEDETEYLEYLAEIEAHIASLSPDDFSPSIDTVLRLFESFELD